MDMCDRNIPTKLKDKLYKTAIKSAMLCGAECGAVRKKWERKLHTTEMRMLRWARGNAILHHVRLLVIWKEAHMLRWYRNVQSRYTDQATIIILQMTVDGWKAKSRQTKAAMARSGERGQKPDDDCYGRIQKTLN